MKSLLIAIDSLMEFTSPLLAIDGPCGGGKSTLAEDLLINYPGAQIFHMDDFFLQPALRNEKRLSEPGGNVDYERFLSEVLQPLSRGEEFNYHVYNCQTDSFSKKNAGPAPLHIIEGSYSLHPQLRDYYDIKVFLQIDEQLQEKRILRRNGENAERFFNEWIPLENQYFNICAVRECSDFLFEQS